VYAACRDGIIYAIKGGALLPTRIEPPSLAVGIVRTALELVVACMDGTLLGYPPKGGNSGSEHIALWSVTLPAPVTAITRVLVRRDRGADAVAVAVEGGRVLVYAQKTLVASFLAPDSVEALAWGQYGREANTLALVLRSGALIFRVLRRNADLEGKSAEAPSQAGARALAEQDVPLPIPKKTRLALEQSARELESAGDMHRLFQLSLVQLRLATAREYLKVLLAKGGPEAAVAAAAESGASRGSSSSAKAAAAAAAQSANPTAPSLSLSCETSGIGPIFSVRVSVLNSGRSAVAELALLFTSAEEKAYFVPDALHPLPLILPAQTVSVEVAVESLRPTAPAGAVLLHVLSSAKRAHARPYVAATVHMPMVA
jgi:Bardet-Biedl syndrome 1 protein